MALSKKQQHFITLMARNKVHDKRNVKERRRDGIQCKMKMAMRLKVCNIKFKKRQNSLGMRFRVAIDGYICASWGANKLIRHPNHWRD